LCTPLGADVEETWGRLVRGERAIAPLTLFDASAQRVALAARVPDAALVDLAPRGNSRGPVSSAWSRTTAMAVRAAREALARAAVDPWEARVGLVVGGTTAGMFETEELLGRFHGEPGLREPLAEMRAHPLTSTGDFLEETLGPFARIRTLSSACSSGANALVVAASWLLEGGFDAVLAGGCDALCRLTLTGFNALAAVDPEACRPFDRRRRGISLGEGAGFLVLERAERARARGTAPLAALAGWAVASEAHHITNPAADGAVVAALVGRALARAGISPFELDYVNAHGTGTPANDAMEAAALARALGEEVGRIPVSSSKGQIGHTLGAAGAIEAAISVLVVARRTLVPTAGLAEPDPSLRLVHIPGVGKEVPRVRAALSNAFGFGGMDTVLVFREVERMRRGPGPVSAAGFGSAHAPGPASAPVRAPASASASSSASSSASTPAASVVPYPTTEVLLTGVAIFGTWGLLGGEECADLLGATSKARGPAHPDAFLDPERARRLDAMARLGAVVVERALADAGVAGPALRASGVILASAYGNVDATAAFLHRVASRGPRFAPPADFPSLVPSSPVGHITIYLGMTGPAFATADLGASGESAFAQAAEFIAAGEARCLVAGCVAPKSDIVDRALFPLFRAPRVSSRAPAEDISAALVLEAEGEVARRGGRALARVRRVVSWRGDPRPALATLGAAPRGGPPEPPDRAGAEVLFAGGDDVASVLHAAGAWASCARLRCEAALGESDALGGVALAVGAARVGAGRTREALILGLAPGRGYAVVLGPP
jgi:3-oxoacyl-[acyl-carrier-protein] synthase II